MTKHEHIYADLKEKIFSGIYPSGSFLPSEQHLCNTYEVTRPPVRQALQRLATEGFLKKVQGRKSEVVSPPKGLGILSLQGTTTAGAQLGLKTKIVTRPSHKLWPKTFPFEINQEERACGTLFFERQRLVKEEVVLFEQTYITNKNLKGFTLLDFDNQSLFHLLDKHYDVKVSRGTQRIFAQKGNRIIRQRLHLVKDEPVLYLERKMETTIPNLNIYSFVYCNTEKYALSSSF